MSLTDTWQIQATSTALPTALCDHTVGNRSICWAQELSKKNVTELVWRIVFVVFFGFETVEFNNKKNNNYMTGLDEWNLINVSHAAFQINIYDFFRDSIFRNNTNHS